MSKKLSKRQFEVMKILWASPSPMIASDIVKSSPELNINTVQAALKTLVKEHYAEVADIVYSGTVLCRSYRPVISSEEYIVDEYRDIMGDFSIPTLIAAFLGNNPEELDEAEKIIQKKKKELEGK